LDRTHGRVPESWRHGQDARGAGFADLERDWGTYLALEFLERLVASAGVGGICDLAASRQRQRSEAA